MWAQLESGAGGLVVVLSGPGWRSWCAGLPVAVFEFGAEPGWPEPIVVVVVSRPGWRSGGAGSPVTVCELGAEPGWSEPVVFVVLSRPGWRSGGARFPVTVCELGAEPGWSEPVVFVVLSGPGWRSRCAGHPAFRVEAFSGPGWPFVRFVLAFLCQGEATGGEQGNNRDQNGPVANSACPFAHVISLRTDGSSSYVNDGILQLGTPCDRSPTSAGDRSTRPRAC
jgi:hypothetical protein